MCGASGSAKSSFAKALIKFCPISGVSYNGIPIADVRKRDLRERVEYLSQNIPIIKGTLRDNLFFGGKWSAEAEAHFKNEPVLQTILADKTLDTEILDSGANLSGGEKQKIALARALQRGADVLILDDICSNIDKASASDIYIHLDNGCQSRITIIITHDTLPESFVDVELNTYTD
ncbi:MAG: ATP-binding cassette domain-containing protein [Clostridiales bacterium]|nr:ATP-binding cassette domain-containing protein [Clostridiales bacterium]